MSKPGLQLNQHYYSPSELHVLCHDKLQHATTPEWEQHLYRFIQHWLADTTHLQVQTSGATGSAKMLTVSKQAMRHSAQLTGQYFNLQAGQNALLCLPVSHIAGQMMVVRAWELGLNLLCCSPQNLCLSRLPSIAFAALVPQQLYHILFEQADAQAQLARVQHLLLGGAALTPPLLAALPDLPCQVFHSYSMTETLTHIAIRRLSPPHQAYYQVLPGIEISTDERNCLVIHAPSLGVKYLVTNDVVKLQGTGQFELLGRFDNLLNSGGFKWHPEQLEAQLQAYPNTILGTRAFFIGAVPDVKLGQKLVLIIEGADELDSFVLQQQLQQIFTPYQCPKAVYYVPHFLRTPTDKIQRQAILNQLLQAHFHD